MARVIAIEAGHDGRHYRHRGEQFDVADDVLGKDGKPIDGTSWYCAVEKAPPPKPTPKNARPPGAGPAKGSAVADPEAKPGAADKF